MSEHRPHAPSSPLTNARPAANVSGTTTPAAADGPRLVTSHEVSAVPSSSFGEYATGDDTVLLMHFNETSGSVVESSHPNQSEFLAEFGVGEPPSV